MEYETKRDVTIPRGTRIVSPAPIAKLPVTYAHCTFDAKVGAEGHFQVSLDDALKDGLIGEVE